MRTGTYDEVRREVLPDIVEVLQDWSVSLYPPPICDHSLGQHDHIACLLFPIDDEMAKAVALERRHCLTPVNAYGTEPTPSPAIGLTHLRNSASEG